MEQKKEPKKWNQAELAPTSVSEIRVGASQLLRQLASEQYNLDLESLAIQTLEPQHLELERRELLFENGIWSLRSRDLLEQQCRGAMIVGWELGDTNLRWHSIEVATDSGTLIDRYRSDGEIETTPEIEKLLEPVKEIDGWGCYGLSDGCFYPQKLYPFLADDQMTFTMRLKEPYQESEIISSWPIVICV